MLAAGTALGRGSSTQHTRLRSHTSSGGTASCSSRPAEVRAAVGWRTRSESAFWSFSALIGLLPVMIIHTCRYTNCSAAGFAGSALSSASSSRPRGQQARCQVGVRCSCSPSSILVHTVAYWHLLLPLQGPATKSSSALSYHTAAALAKSCA
jgi:hypothetical protein